MKIPFFFLSILLCSGTSAQLHLSAIFNDHMILQRDKPVRIWGTAGPGETVRAGIGQINESGRADKNGYWLITLRGFAAGGPYTLRVQTKTESKVFTDVLFGEVWLCSGQSNMQFKLRQAINAKYEIHRANNPLIRQVSIPDKLSLHPENFIDSTKWVISTPQTSGDFTAVGYFFARNIYDQLHVPVGLINDNWGGSQVESWISRDAMMGSDELKDYARQIPGSWEEIDTRTEKQLNGLLAERNGGKIPVMDLTVVLKDNYSFNGWMPSSAPGIWDWAGLPGYRGQGYLVKEIYLDSVQAQLPSTLNLGIYDSRYNWYVNGIKISKPADKNFLVSLPSKSWKAGRNVVLLDIGPEPVPDWIGVGLMGDNDQFYLDFDGERIPLADGKWKMLPLLDKPHHFMKWMNSEGTIIYNAMIHPIIPVSIRGVLWYQGEANTAHAFEYRKTFPLMIENWRKEWQDDFPFLFVQLASFGSNENSNTGSDWAELRESQSLALRLPRTGMSVTTDIGDPNDVHPKNKQEVGRRLAAIALNRVYGIQQTDSGPVYDSVSFLNSEAILFFKSTGKGLFAKDKNGYLRGFEIAGADHKFYFARAHVCNSNQVVVSSDSVSRPVSVRYGWSNAPVDINLYNLDGFPASPFRTDNWSGVTDAAGFYKLPSR